MRRNLLILSLLASFTLLLSANAFADGQGNVDVYADGNLTIYLGETTTLEYYCTNDAVIAGLSLGYEFSWNVALSVAWNMGYGNKPPVNEEGDAVGAMTLLFAVTNLLTGVSPDTVLYGGAALPGGGLPIHAAPALCYTMQMTVTGPDGSYPDGFCIDNIFVPPAGTWNFTDSSPYPPDYQGNPNPSGQTNNPDAPPVCFLVETRPCANPVFTNCPSGPKADVNQNHCVDFTYDFDADPNDPQCPNGEDDVTYTASVGTINANTGEYTLTAPGAGGCGVVSITITATNCCGASTDCVFDLEWINNDPDIDNCPTTTGKVAMGNPWVYNFNVVDPDFCDNFSWTVNWLYTTPVNDPPVGSYGINGLGQFTFDTADPDDGGKTFCFEVVVDDGCGGTDVCEFCVEVLETQPFLIRINKVHDVYQGHYVWVCIGKVLGSEKMGGFDFLVAYDASALTFISAELGWLLDAQGDGWEYFTYRYGPWGNCTGPCPSGFVRLVAIADMNNGPNHPRGYGAGHGQLVDMKFYVTNDRTYECMFVPIRFIWQDCGDCGDNAISSVTGDTLFISERVFDFEWNSGWQCGDPVDLTDPSFELTGIDWDMGLGFFYGGAPDTCLVGDKTFPIRFIWFWNGGVDIVCADSIDRRGDMNLNGIENEIADAVVYTNYFLFGPIALDIAYEAQVAASYVNADGLVLSVGDLVYLIRIIVGDALPYPKIAPFANTATLNVVSGAVSTNASSEIGAVWATFNVNGAYDVTNHTDMELKYEENDGQLRVLVYSGLENMTNRIPAGSVDLFTVSGQVDLVDAQISDYDGNMLDVSVNKVALPTEFALLQNVPNPFNPTTKIGIELPVVSDWTLDIYNVAGQLVKSFNGHGVGSFEVEWNATNVASGIYFYRMTAGDFSATKKMVLMK
jgi:hypothetical protein